MLKSLLFMSRLGFYDSRVSYAEDMHTTNN